MLGSYLISDLRWHTHKIRSPSLGQVMLKSSQPRPCWAVEALPLRRCVSDVLWDIPSEKSWSVLSDPVIHAGGSWAFGIFGRLFPSGEDSVEEGESLLLMFLGFHSFCYNTTPFSKKNQLKQLIRPSKMLVCNNISGNVPLIRMKNRGANIVAHVVGVSKEEARAKDWALNSASLGKLDFHKWHQMSYSL